MFILFNNLCRATAKHLPGRLNLNSPEDHQLPKGFEPYSIKGVLTGEKIDVSQKIFGVDFISLVGWEWDAGQSCWIKSKMCAQPG